MQTKHKLGITITIAVLMVTLISQFVSAAPFTRDMYYGMTGDDIYDVQVRLSELGYGNGGLDGYFGEYTENIVIAYQQDYGLYADGVIGPCTYSYLFPENTATTEVEENTGTPVTTGGALSRDLYYGLTGDDVYMIQKRLEELGYATGGLDSYFGYYTELAVLAYQADHGLYQDGVVGNVTYSSLFKNVASEEKPKTEPKVEAATETQQSTAATSASISLSRDLYYGLTGDDVLAVQKRLEELGYSVGGLDGYFGTLTENAVKSFQLDHGLYVDGLVGYTTLSKLNDKTISAASSGAGTLSNSGTVISLGDTGSNVTAIQTKLYQLGYMNSGIDGYYGSLTSNSVRAFQALNGLSTTGKVDAATLNKLNSTPVAFQTIQEGSNSSLITSVQNHLVRYGILSSADGVYGAATRNAVSEIQGMNSFTQTGVVDLDTLILISGLGSNVYTGGAVTDYYSATNWIIYVNTTTNRLSVYYGGSGNWSLVKDWQCTTGALASPTVLGEYSTNYNRGFSFSDHDYTCYYYTSFYGPYLMHSVLYQSGTMDILNNVLGANLSGGCIRLRIENAKWIYDNIPIGTKVVIVN